MVTVTEVEKGSLAEKSGILPGDILLSIDSNPIRDVLDYRFFLTENKITLSLKRDDLPFEVTIKKGRYDDIGLEFETFLMDQKRRCSNRCIFCFIDQNPPGMRETVYFKDDDTRLSFLMGNYVTLTNVTDEELRRIIKMRLSPVNVSVHTTNPELRTKMLGNKKASRIMDQLRILKEGKIDINCQIVSCHGYNDGKELERTITELEELTPALQSIAVVPVGLTDYREGLTEIPPYDEKSAGEVVDIVEKYAKIFYEKHGSRLVFAADEFYIAAKRDLPPKEDYEEYPQLDNGVGLIRNDGDEILEELEWRAEEEWNSLPKTPVEITIATGMAAKDFISDVCQKITAALPQVRFRVMPVENRFFGKRVTVAGLMCGRDLIEEAKKEKPRILFFPAVALRHERDRFLDDVTVEDLEKEVACPVYPVENGTAILDTIETILNGR